MVEHSGLMLVGAFFALAWANHNIGAYHHFVEYDLGSLWGIHLTPHFIINDILMVFYFGIAAKEIREAFLPGGALQNRDAWGLPFLITAGGMAAPALCFIGMAMIIQRDLLPAGIAIPTATDIAFARLGGKFIYGSTKHPAVVLLTVLAINDDAGGLVVLAVFYQAWDFIGLGIGSVLLFVAIALTFAMRRFGITNYVAYVIPGAISWVALHIAGLHPVLALVPIVFFMPHSLRDEGLFGEEHRQGERRDTLNQFEHHFEVPIEVVLFAFAFFNAGVELSSIGPGTIAVLFSLDFGKPLGIFVVGIAAIRLLGYALPQGTTRADLLVVGMLAGVGFTVALFVAGVAYEQGVYLEQSRLGALLSFTSLGTAILTAWLLRVGRFRRHRREIVEPGVEQKCVTGVDRKVA